MAGSDSSVWGYLNVGFIALAVCAVIPGAIFCFVKLHQRSSKSRVAITWIKVSAAVISLWDTIWLIQAAVSTHIDNNKKTDPKSYIVSVENQLESATNLLWPCALAIVIYTHLELVLAVNKRSLLGPLPRIGAKCMLFLSAILSITRFVVSQCNNGQQSPDAVLNTSIVDTIMAIVLFLFSFVPLICLLRVCSNNSCKLFQPLLTISIVGIFRQLYDVIFFAFQAFTNLKNSLIIYFFRILLVTWSTLACLAIYYLLVSKSSSTKLWDRPYRDVEERKRNFYQQSKSLGAMSSGKSFAKTNPSSKTIPTQYGSTKTLCKSQCNSNKALPNLPPPSRNPSTKSSYPQSIVDYYKDEERSYPIPVPRVPSSIYSRYTVFSRFSKYDGNYKEGWI